MNLNPLRGLTATRYLKSLIVAKGNYGNAEAYASSQGWDNESQVVEYIRAAITAQGSDPNLTRPAGMDLLALVRPNEIVSRVPGVRHVPFDTPDLRQSGGTSAYWPGEGKPASLSKPSFASVITLPRLKVIALSVIMAELAMSASVNAEATLSFDFATSLLKGTDSAFIDVSNAGVAGAKPAAVTYGAPAFAIAGTTPAQIDAGLQSLTESLLANGSTLEKAVFIMHPASAAFLATVRGSGGARAYPDINVRGGFLNGLPVLASASVPWGLSPHLGIIALLDGSRLWLADESEVEFNVSRNATIQMLDNPTNDTVTPTATTAVSMWQTNAMVLRSERFINWKLAEAGACAVATCPF